MSDAELKADSLDVLARRVAEAYFAGCRANPQDFANFFQFKLGSLYGLESLAYGRDVFWRELSRLVKQCRGLRMGAADQRRLAQMTQEERVEFACFLAISGQNVFADAIAEEIEGDQGCDD